MSTLNPDNEEILKNSKKLKQDFDFDFICKKLEKEIDKHAFTSYIQNKVLPAQYWRGNSEKDFKNFLKHNTFLKSINMLDLNQTIDHQQVENLHKISGNFVLMKFIEDEVVVPRESQWFGAVNVSDEGEDSTEEVVPMEKLPVFQRLGLDRFRREGRLKMIEYDSSHMAFTDEWFVSEIVEKYLV